LDPSTKDPNSCTNLLPSPNSNDYPFVNHSLLISTYSFGGLNIVIGNCVPTLSMCIV
jgi:hypothetical protein